MTEPLVTLVISPREGHFMAERSLLSVLADDAIPFHLIYVDIASPPHVAKALRARVEARGFTYRRHDEWIAPTLARKQAIASVTTRYVACVDNDVLIEPGCLKALVDCAEETGAGLVCPLYIQAGGDRPPSVHMAGGRFVWSEGERPTLVGEIHRLGGADMEAAASLTRGEADYTEYHYVLGRGDLMRRPETISEDILLIHEHLDLALVARSLGLAVMFEPAARITYFAFEPRPIADAPFFRRRWEEEACRRSVLAFGDKWGCADQPGLVDRMLRYSANRMREVEVRRLGSGGLDLAEPMTRAELAQDRSALREVALGRGYEGQEMRAIEEAADLATVFFDGLYRPDGRPFLNHVIGVAGVLVRYELDIDIVRAALLHAVVTHRSRTLSPAEQAAILARTPKVRRLIAAQSPTRGFLDRESADLSSLNLVGVGAACVLAANEADMRLSGEYRATGRPRDLSDSALDRISAILPMFGVEGLARSARASPGEGAAWPLFGAAPQHVSFRLDAPTPAAESIPAA